MKRAAVFVAGILLFCVVLCGSFWIATPTALADGSAAVTIPDPDFRQALLDEGVQADGNGDITQDAMAALTILDISGSDIDDLTGIGYAVNLTSLTISYTSITSLPAEISNLTELKTLKLYVNVNMSAAGLPATLWDMTGLTTLDLELDNVDTVPAGLARLTGLTELNLYGNGIGTLPDFIGGMTNLEKLYLHQNNLSELPDSICNLTHLKELTLWENELGALPANFGSLASLTDLDLSTNKLETLPASFKNLAALDSLKLYDNLLMSLPAGAFANMKALKTLDIYDNFLDPLGGPDKAELDAAKANGAAVDCSKQHAYAVNLDYNGGSGPSMPRSYYYGESVTLPVPVAGSRMFTGWDTDGDNEPEKQAGDAVTIAPSDMTVGSVSFKAIYGYAVKFTLQTFGSKKFGMLDGGTTDVTLDVNAGEKAPRVPAVSENSGYEFLGWYDGSQQVSGADILNAAVAANKTYTARFDAIGTIAFHDAAFAAALSSAGADSNGDGFITTSEMQGMTELDLSGGQFTDITGVGQASNLQILRLGAGKVASLPGADIAKLTKLMLLDVGGNPVSTLPDSLSGLSMLKELDMDHCALSALPVEIEDLAGLEILDISFNKLKMFPSLLLGNSGLKTLDLSGNLLTGLPTSLGGMTGLASLDLNNNYFYPGGMPASTPAFAAYSSQHTYAVTLDFKGGQPVTPVTHGSGYCFGEPVSLPAATKAGCDFYGWDADGDGKADIVGAGSACLTPDPPDSVSSRTYSAIYLSQNACLSGVSLSAGAYLSSAFSQLQQSYTVTLYDYVGSVTITPLKANAQAKMLIGGVEKGSAAVPLASSSATADVQIDLTAEDGVHTCSYTLHVVRAPLTDLSLSGVTLTPGVKMSPAFSSAGMEYTAFVPASTGSVAVTANRAGTLTQVAIDGVSCSTLSRSVSVGVGAVKTVSIVVSAPANTDKTKTYTLTLKRGTSLSVFCASPKAGTAYTLSPGGTNRMTFSYKMGGPGSVKLEVLKGTKWIQVMSRTEPSAGVKSWAWDGKVSGVYLAAATYSVRITPTANGIAGTASTISVKIAPYPVVTWKTVTNPFKAAGISRALCLFKVSAPTNAVVQIYNSRGKVAATVKSFTNLMPSSTYTTVAWDGKATSDNTAGLKAGALVPAGTYAVRITVGLKVYTKTIKITR